MLTNEERRVFSRQAQIEHAIAMFLDIEGAHSLAEIAAEMGITVEQLKNLTRGEDFDALWNAHFMDLGHDPRLKAGQAAIADMVAIAARELKRSVTNPRTPESVRLKAIELIFKYGGIEATKPAQNDKKDLAEFLNKAGVNIGNVNVIAASPLPAQFQDPFAFSRDDEVVDAVQTPTAETRGIVEGQNDDSPEP
jgi:hypothetical protein